MALSQCVWLLTVFCMINVHVDGQTITDTKAAYAGQPATIVCPLQGNYTYPGWRGPPNGTTYNYRSLPTINQIVANRTSFTVNQRDLVITNVTMSDAGTYKCIAVINGSLQEGWLSLNVRIHPQTPVISDQQTTGTVVGTEGQPLTLTCTSRGGNPAPNVTWYHGTTQSTAVSSSSTVTEEGDGYTVTANYTFTPTRAHDGVNYICQPSYTSTADVLDSVGMTLRLNLKPSQPTVEQVGVVQAGSNVTVRCTTSSFRPAAGITMTWTYNGSAIPTVAAPSINGTDTYMATSTTWFPVQKADNGGSPECAVFHTTLYTPLTTSTAIDVHYVPELVNVTGSSPFTANGVNELTITCAFVAGNPGPPSISWSRTSRTGTVTQPASTQTTLVLTPTWDDDGDTIRCTANNSVGAVTSGPFTLDLRYITVASIPGGDVTVTECSPATALTCTATGKPAPTFTWYKDGQAKALKSGLGTGIRNLWTYTYNIPDVHRGQAGRYWCQVDNRVGSANTTYMELIVQYPPEVVAIATKNGQYVNLTCSPSGVPSIYLYSNWVQSWPGYGEITRPILEAAATLRLSNLTYAHSGVYKCRVSNGIAPYGTSWIIRTAYTAAITIKSRPVIVTPSGTNYINKFALKMGHPASVTTTYYSPSTPTLFRCYKVIDNVRQSTPVGTVTTEATQINLPVFSSMVPTLGTRSTVTWKIVAESGLGVYDIVVTNAIGEASVLMEAIMEGPPDNPEQLQVLNIKPTRVDVSWQSGFHGGYPQTAVVQYSIDGVTWIDGPSLDTGVSVSRELNQVAVTSLSPGTIYYLRMYAHNQLGSSPDTYVHNVTTCGTKNGSLADASGLAGSSFGEGVAIGAGAVAALNFVGVIVTVVFYKKGYRIRNGKYGTEYTGSEQTYENDTMMDEVQGQRKIDSAMSENYIVPKSDTAPNTYEMLDSVGTVDSATYTDLGLYESTTTQQQEYENMRI